MSSIKTLLVKSSLFLGAAVLISAPAYSFAASPNGDPAQIANLLAQIQSLNNIIAQLNLQVQMQTANVSIVTPVIPGFHPTAAFTIGERVQTTATLNVRDRPSTRGRKVGTQPAGALGTIRQGPIREEGYVWWNVNFDSGADGWSVQNYLTPYVVDTFPPTAPTGFTATAVSTSQVNLSWNPATDNVGVVGYHLFRNGTNIATVTNTSYADTGLLAGTTYAYGVNAFDTAGNVSGSASTTATTPSPIPTASITVSLAADAPLANQVVMGSTQNPLASYLFTETSNHENVNITGLTVFDPVSVATVKSSFANLSLWNGSTLVGSAGGPQQLTNGYSYGFQFATPPVIPQAGSLELALRGDVASYSSSGATDNSAHSFGVTSVTALSATSNSLATVALSSPNGNSQTVLRTKLGVTATPLGPTSGRVRSSVDDLGILNFSANSAGTLRLNGVAVTFTGTAPGPNFWDTAPSSTSNNMIGSCPTCYVTLYDPENGVSYYPIFVSASAANGMLAFNMNSYQLSAGSSKSFNLRINSAQLGVFASGATSTTLTATIVSPTNITWTDALAGGTSGIGLPASSVPIVINSVAYATGP